MKRVFDVVASLVGLILLSPILIGIMLWIKVDSPGPVLFRQVRVGLHGKPFKIHKFRTMAVNSESKGRLSVGRDSRITEAGYFLRKYKLDELLQLFDVFRGKMSLVGPRPEVQEFIDEYSIETRDKVLSVRPGITDLAAIEMVGESDILSNYSDVRQGYIDEILPIKQKYYMNYVDSQSLWLDFKIILLTIKKIVSR
jgi:lipopolysaccharide/colanic/teichoic acid biosynthesis glycosyltransferase